MAFKQKKSVKKTVGHDNLSVDAKYATGGRFRFSISRGGERVLFGGASGAEGTRQLTILAAWAKRQGAETNGQLVDRVHAACEKANSIGELVAWVEVLTVPTPPKTMEGVRLCDYANARGNVVLFWVSVGQGGGAYSLMGCDSHDFADTQDLLYLTGRVDGGDWYWDGEGDRRDYRGNTITKLHAYVDAKKWAELASEM